MWSEHNNQLVKTFKFADFTAALEFVNRVAVLAETANHHPDISFGWGYAKISLTTHSQGRVTDKDRTLAQAIDDLLSMPKRYA